MPVKELSSVEHAGRSAFTTDESEEFVQTAWPHMPCAHLSRGPTSEVSLPAEITPSRPDGFKQAASEFVRMPASAVWHPDEIL